VIRRAFLIVRGSIYALGFIGLWAWLAVTVRRLDPRVPLSIPTWLAPIGWAIGVAGALLALTCVVTFLTIGRGTPAPFDPPRKFVAVGPYRWVRNPMYVGGFGALLGGGLIVASPAIVLLAFGFLLLMHLFVALHEEPALSERFGDSYRQYKASVSRWLVKRPRR
jgi:protein-S-isoprenylcysteine O-methyltransferase Ste14